MRGSRIKHDLIVEWSSERGCREYEVVNEVMWNSYCRPWLRDIAWVYALNPQSEFYDVWRQAAEATSVAACGEVILSVKESGQ